MADENTDTAIVRIKMCFTSRIYGMERVHEIPIDDDDKEFIAMLRDRWQKWWDKKLASIREEQNRGGATLG